MINKLAIDALKMQYQLPFIDEELLEISFTNPSTFGTDRSDNRMGIRYAWDNLHMIGVKVLQLCISSYVFFNYSYDSRTQLECVTKLKNNYRNTFFDNNQLVTECALLVNPYNPNNDDANQKLMFTFLGYIYYRFGFNAVYSIIKKDCQSIKLESIDYLELVDSKTALQEFTQKVYRIGPTYSIVKEEGPDNEKQFTVKVDAEKYSEIGEGDSKKQAETDAAKKYLILHCNDYLKQQQKKITVNKYTVKDKDYLLPDTNITMWFSGATSILLECIQTKAYANEKGNNVKANDIYVPIGSDVLYLVLIDILLSSESMLYEVKDLSSYLKSRVTAEKLDRENKVIIDDISKSLKVSFGERNFPRSMVSAQRDAFKALFSANFISAQMKNEPINKIADLITMRMKDHLIGLNTIEEKNTSSHSTDFDYTSLLQSICQGLEWSYDYIEGEETGPVHMAEHSVSCRVFIPGFSSIEVRATGSSKKGAKKAASKRAFEAILDRVKRSDFIRNEIISSLCSSNMKDASRAIVIKNLIIPAEIDLFQYLDSSQQIAQYLAIYAKNQLRFPTEQIKRCISLIETENDYKRADFFFQLYPDYLNEEYKRILSEKRKMIPFEDEIK